MLFLAAALVALDQLTKAWVVANLPRDGTEIALALGFGITHTRNGGAAFGILRDLELRIAGLTIDGTVLLGLLSAAVSLGLIVYLLRNARRLSAIQATAAALVLAGAAGNMIDRLRLGYVVDLIHFKVGSFDFPVFNVADACVVIGAGLLILGSLMGSDHAEGAPVKRSPLPRNHVLDDVPDLPPLGGRPPSDGA
ncbi:MAG: signal peptidase II [Trueperaceae bacterium]|jgi:signal peptidase II|nr:signal peptidase II [Truepera sp.]HRN17929.1 signal peptidase II [Trueperaceae bacterium]HRQ10112.1 signal peptidase II [Trueperaceae bacterium]